MNPLFSVNDPGHNYVLNNVENGTQALLFIRKAPDADGKLVTGTDGTTTEAVLAVLLDRLQFLNELLPSDHNDEVMSHIEQALAHLGARTNDRKERGVEGTSAE